MRMRDVVLTFAGGCLVYGAMAACSSGGANTMSASSRGQTSGAPGMTSGSPGTSGGMMAGTGGTSPGTASGGTSGTHGAGGLMNPVPPASADPTDGSRLKAEYRVADDGSKEAIPGMWYDTMRMETCAFSTADDGSERCLPAGAVASALSYIDSACTMGVVGVASGCAQPPYIALPSSSSAAACSASGGGTSIYSVGAAMTPTTLYVSAAGQCFPLGMVPAATYYTLGSEVAATSFVGSTMMQM